MTTKQERLKEVYDHLRSYFGIHTQIDFAEAIRITRPALSSAMNGNEAYLTKMGRETFYLKRLSLQEQRQS